jgi:hypothetical protein
MDTIGPMARDVAGVAAGLALLEPGFQPVATTPFQDTLQIRGSGAWNSTYRQYGDSQRRELFRHASSVPCCGIPGRPAGRGADYGGTAGLERSFISLSAFVPNVAGYDR